MSKVLLSYLQSNHRKFCYGSLSAIALTTQLPMTNLQAILQLAGKQSDATQSVKTKSIQGVKRLELNEKSEISYQFPSAQIGTMKSTMGERANQSISVPTRLILDCIHSFNFVQCGPS